MFADLLLDEFEIIMITFSKLYSPTRTLRSEALNLATQENVNSRQKSDVDIMFASYLIFFTGATGGARVNFFWPV